MDSFTKRVLKIPLDKPFEEAYFTHRLWMFFRETKENEHDIHRMFNHVREKMKQMITLEKKSDPGKFAVPCLFKGIEFPCALCDTGSSVSILPKVMADHLGLKIEPSKDSFTFVDYSTRNSEGIIRNLEVQIRNALVPVDFHVLDNKLNMNHSLLLGRAFMANVGSVCNMQTNQLCLTLINPEVVSTTIQSELSSHIFEYEKVYEALIDSQPQPSIDNTIQPTINNHTRESIDISHADETFALPIHFYPSFAVNTQPQTSIDYHHGDTINRQGDYSVGSWADDSHHESFAVNTALHEMQPDDCGNRN
ncbi:hypothetical protein DY000_02007878 [Brassica cretica]|uniref:Aspartic peptidase DDI1-type domain-containing protein n=1 Tax=Brassica cretica TaxID=69181 RepID=A0ABQ7BXL8_BRACR|nr:hypothetical protein DY000_02007878 [Brassica cretica]